YPLSLHDALPILAARLGPSGGQPGQRLGIGGIRKLNIDPQLLISADHIRQRLIAPARYTEIRAFIINARSNRLDPAISLYDPLVALISETEQDITLNQRLGQFRLQRVQQAHLSRHIGSRIDNTIGAAEICELLPQRVQAVRSLLQLIAR